MKKARVFIIGGGLAGLTSAIHLSQKGIQVVLFEKEQFPHHKVCGEYLSREILPYLNSLGVNLDSLYPVQIDRLDLSSANGNSISTELKMGGLGISRFALDNHLFQKARQAGCEIVQETVKEVFFKSPEFEIHTISGKTFRGDYVIGAFGKRSNLDKSLKRGFFQKQSEWLAVKAHYNLPDFPSDLVALHNFSGGYCGISKGENGHLNVCYLASYKSFKKHKNTEDFKDNVLRKNPRLDSFFDRAEIVFPKELSIAQISFQKKEPVENHIFMVGDAAGLIHPLCGNGMAMAIHSAKIVSECLLKALEGKLNRPQTESLYSENWNEQFGKRLKAGRLLQNIMMNPYLENLGHKALNFLPGLLPSIIEKTHGNYIYE